MVETTCHVHVDRTRPRPGHTEWHRPAVGDGFRRDYNAHDAIGAFIGDPRQEPEPGTPVLFRLALLEVASLAGQRISEFGTLGARTLLTQIQMKFTIIMVTVALALLAAVPMAQSTDLEARINELEAALDHLQERIEKLEQRQTPQRMSEAEAHAVLRKKQLEDECTQELGPAPEFAPVLGTKVNPGYMAYLKEHRACMREKGLP